MDRIVDSLNSNSANQCDGDIDCDTPFIMVQKYPSSSYKNNILFVPDLMADQGKKEVL